MMAMNDGVSCKWVKFALLAGSMLSGSFLPGAAPAAAQQASVTAMPAEAVDSDEIVVTAQKRAQNLQDVGLSVTALGATALAAVGRQDVTALAGQVPSLQVNQFSPTTTIFNLRGVSQNDFSDAQEAPIAFYNDEVYVGALGAISGQTFDLKRIEVLRGPQGTLFGRNATGGIVQIITAKPTRELEAFATLTVGSYGQVATEAAISGPLTDWLRARLSATSNHHGGYIENTIGPDIGNARFYGGRLQFEADVGAEGMLSVKLQGLRNDNERSGGAYAQQTVVPNADGLGRAIGVDEDFYGTGPGADPFGFVKANPDPFVQSFDRTPLFDRKYYSITLRYEQKFGDIDFVSLSDYQNLSKRYGEDTDMTLNPIFNYDTSQELYQLSQEFRLSGKRGALQWLVGAYGFKTRTDNTYRVDLSGIGAGVTSYGGRQETTSLAGFGQLEYAISDQFTLIGGARYSSDIKTFNFANAADGALQFAFNQALFPDLARRHDGAFSGKAEINFKPSDGSLLYASISKGTKGGGFNVQAFAPFIPARIPFGDESLISYEAGLKLKIADRTTLNGAVFYYDYQNYQAFVIKDLVQSVVNRPATVKGAEVEFNTRPVDGLSLQLFATYLDGRVMNITLPGGRIADRDLPQAPAFSGGGNVRYEFDIGPGSLALSTDWKYDSSQFFSTFNSPIDREPPRIVGNARIAYSFAGNRWEVAGFVNNLTDRQYRIYNLDLASSGLGIANQAYARPRWFGISVTCTLQ
jgi:iron complex outermembrane recepter protein